MSDLNQCQFIGRLGKDPDIRYLPDGSAVANFSLACDWKSKTKKGTEWISCTAFGKLAEIIGEYTKKGSQVFVSGSMKTEKWEKDGKTNYMTKIMVNNLQMLGSKPVQDDAPSEPKKPANEQKVEVKGFDDFDSNIPF